MEIAIAAETLFHLGFLPVTNTLLMTWFAMAVLIVVSFLIRQQLAQVPRGLQNIAETIIEQAVDILEQITGDRHLAQRFFPIIFTFFLFIVTANWMGLLPGLGSVGFHEVEEGRSVFVPLLRSVHSDLTMTLALAITSVVMAQVMGFAVGGIGFAKRYLNFSNPIMFCVGILEFFSELSKILSFSFRLFGNIFAGEVLLTIIGHLVPFLAPLPFYGLELFVGLIQALVFSMLSLVFFTMMTAHAEH